MSAPLIVDLKWGQITVQTNQMITVYKDCRLSPSHSDIWDWNRTGTRHVPGIQWNDLADLLRQHPNTDMIILSRGMDNILQVHPQTLKRLQVEYPWIAVEILNTRDAVQTYNDRRSTKKIIGLFHSTC